MKLRGDITRSQIKGYQYPHKEDLCSPIFFPKAFGGIEEQIILGNFFSQTINIKKLLCASGNIFVIITIFRFMNRESVTNLFIANLSFGDILVLGFALPFRVSNLLNIN